MLKETIVVALDSEPCPGPHRSEVLVKKCRNIRGTYEKVLTAKVVQGASGQGTKGSGRTTNSKMQFESEFRAGRRSDFRITSQEGLTY